MEIHIDYVIYLVNFVIYVVLCSFIIKQARQDIFAPKKKEDERPMCPKHGAPFDMPFPYEENMKRS